MEVPDIVDFSKAYVQEVISEPGEITFQAVAIEVLKWDVWLFVGAEDVIFGLWSCAT